VKLERRVVHVGNLEVRATADGRREYRGDAIRFGESSENLGGFVEFVDPDAEIVADDVRHLINHDPNLVLGRTTAGTTRLERSGEAVTAHTDMPDTTYARDLEVSIDRKDVDQMSFGFRVIQRADGSAGDSWDFSVKPARRTLHAFELSDVSTVTYPAYPTTTAEVRSLLLANGIRELGPAVVAWDDEAGMCDYMQDVSESLPSGWDGDDYAWGYCCDVTIAGDSALVAWYDNGECVLYVTPVTLDDDGEPAAGPQDSWQPVEWQLVTAERAAAMRSTLELRAGKALSSANADHVAAIGDAHAAMSSHLDALMAAAGTDSDADGDGSATDETNAARLDFELRMLAIREAGGDPDNRER
jgi:HK97 family phage prohead protease